MFKSILVPVDGSESARVALEVACKLAHVDQARLHILHVPQRLAHEKVLVWGAGTVSLKASPEELEEAGGKLLSGARQAAAERGITAVEGSLHQGDPALVILDQADDLGVDAIVMGSRGLSNIAGLVVGSVSHKVSHVASCHVISVR